MERRSGAVLAWLVVWGASGVGWNQASAAESAKVAQTRRAPGQTLAAASLHHLALGPQRRGLTPLHWVPARPGEGGALMPVRDGAEAKPLPQVLPPVAPGQLRAAAYDADPEAVEDLLRRGANVNDPSPSGVTPLHRVLDRVTYERSTGDLTQAQTHEAERVVELLVRYGADVNALDAQGRMPLHAAMHDEHELMVATLVQHGAQVNARTPNGATPLFMTARNDAPYVAIRLLDRGADPNLAGVRGYAPLFMAAHLGNTRTLEVLLEYGADPNVQDAYGLSPLLWTTRSMSVDYLMSADTPGGREFRAGLDQAKQEAIWRDWEEGDNEFDSCVMLLLAKGADPSVSVGGRTPLIYAATVGDGETVAALIAKRVELGLPPVGAQELALHAALTEGHAEVAEQLIHAGADVNMSDSQGRTPLHCAAGLVRDRDLAELLVSRGANVQARDKDGRTPLAYALHFNNEPMAAVLRQHGGI